jgi:hypothetical protein
VSVDEGRTRYRDAHPAARPEPTAIDVLTSAVRRGANRWAARRGSAAARAALVDGEQAAAGLRQAAITDQAVRRGLEAVGMLEEHDLAELSRRGEAAVALLDGEQL